MSKATVSCPYCNALVDVPELPPQSGRMTCPRCGDPFPLHASAVQVDGVVSANIDQEVSRHRQARKPSGLRSPKGMLLFALGLGLLGIVVGLAITYFKENKPAQPTTHVESANAVAPADMPGLAFLPEGADSVIALQLRPLIASLPEADRKNAAGTLIGLGVPADVVAGLDRAVGVGLDQIDQMVLGLKLADGLQIQQIVLVVITRESYSIETLVDKWKAKPFTKNGRTYYNVRASRQVPFDLHCWAPNDRVLVAGLDFEQLGSIPSHGNQGLGHLSPRLVEIVNKQLAPETNLWAVLDSEKWDAIAEFLVTFLGKRGGNREQIVGPISHLRTAVVFLRNDAQPSVTGWFDLKSEAIATDFRKWLDSKTVAEKIPVTVGGAGNRVMLRTSARDLQSVIQKVIALNK